MTEESTSRDSFWHPKSSPAVARQQEKNCPKQARGSRAVLGLARCFPFLATSVPSRLRASFSPREKSHCGGSPLPEPPGAEPGPSHSRAAASSPSSLQQGPAEPRGSEPPSPRAAPAAQAGRGRIRRAWVWRRTSLPAPPGPGGERAPPYLLRGAAGVRLGVSRRARAAPRGRVEAPGIVLVHVRCPGRSKGSARAGRGPRLCLRVCAYVPGVCA